MMDTDLLAGLNPAQRAAVTSNTSVLQILAPPGSGKTKTLTTRVAYLLSHHGYSPRNVICCTFTVKAAREMRERLRGLVGCELESELILGTFHSICRRYLAAYGPLIGIQKGFGIADTSDSLSIIKKICKKGDYKIEPKTARARISSHKAKNKRIDDVPRSSTQPEHQEFRQIYQLYETALATSNLLDYDDLLLYCLDLLQKHPTCVSNIEGLLIDEFQDTNVVQLELMKALASAKRRVTVVGDPDQSIYGWRSAESENLRRMKAFYPETVVINLEENYRSSSAILKLAQDVIEQDSDRPNKKLKSTHCYGTLPVLRKLPNPHEEAAWITAEIKRTTAMSGGLVQHSDIAVLIRSAYLSLLIEKSFTALSIPYRMVGGMKFFDRAEIKLIIDYLRVISHPQNDPAFLAIINVPSRKIGDATVASLVSLGEEKGISVWEVVQKVLKGTLRPEKKMSNPSEQDLQKLVNLVNDGRKKMEATTPAEVPGVLIEFIVSKLSLQAYLQKKYKDDYEDRIENIVEFVSHAKDVAAMSMTEQLPTVGMDQQQPDGGQEALDQFLATIVLDKETDSIEKGDDTLRVTISTIHSAKGLEWPVVFIPAIYEGSIPHSRAEDAGEERRLLYVAMTRAQVLLTLTFPLQQSREQEQSSLTPFLPDNIRKRLRDHGPVLSDEVVADIATILRRDMPSQEALTLGLQSLGDKGSAEDNIWPLDGAHRVSPDVQSLMPILGQSLHDAEQRGRFGYTFNSSTSVSTWNTKYGSGTTMTSASTFSTSNLSTVFTTARQQFKDNPQPSPTVPTLIHSASNPEPPKKRLKLEKTKSAQGNIMNFFSKPEAETAAEQTRAHWQTTSTQQTQRLQPSLPPVVHSTSVYHTNTIPTELAQHRLAPSSIRGGFKRPRSALEPTSPNRRADKSQTRDYIFLSSSPPPEDQTMEHRHHTQADDEPVDVERDASDENSIAVSKEHSLKKQLFTNTLQPAALAAVHAKKTLGVRRAFGGWDARKNK